MNEASSSFRTTPFSNFSYSKNESNFTDISENAIEDHFPGYSQELMLFGAIFSVIFSILGIFGNSISILALSNCRHLKSATTSFIVNLCVSDLLFSSFSISLTSSVFFSRKWFSNDPLCQFFAFMRFSNPMVSIFTILAITINRFILIGCPNFYPFLYKKRPMAVMIAVIWLFPIALLLLPLSEVWGQLGHNPNGGSCSIVKLHGKSPKTFIYIIGLGLPSLIFILCYLAIYYKVKKIEAENSSASYRMAEDFVPSRQIYKRRFRLVRIMLVIFTLYTICYLPMFLLKFFSKGKRNPTLHILCYICYFFSSVVNPVIYVAMSKEYRKAYKNLFRQFNLYVRGETYTSSRHS